MARKRRVSAPLSSVGRGAHAAGADRGRHERHLQRRGQHLALADGRRADREVVADLGGGGIVERAAPTGPGSWLKPKRSAVSTRCSAPSFAPSGAKTELQECCEADSAASLLARLAVGVLDLDALDRRPPSGSGTCPSAWPLLASRTPASVTILNVLPGRLRRRLGDAGQRQNLAVALGARPRSRRSGRRAPRRRRAGMSGSIVVRTALARLAGVRGQHAGSRRSSVPARVCRASRSSNSRSRPVRPIGRPFRDPARLELRRARSGGGGPRLSRDLRGSADRDRTARSGPLGHRGCRHGPAAWPRSGRIVSRRSRSPRPQARVDEVGAPVHAGAGVLALARPGASRPAVQGAEDARL